MYKNVIYFCNNMGHMGLRLSKQRITIILGEKRRLEIGSNGIVIDLMLMGIKWVFQEPI